MQLSIFDDCIDFFLLVFRGRYGSRGRFFSLGRFLGRASKAREERAGEKGKRSGLKHSRVMIHQPLSGAQGQASDIEIAAQEVLKIKDELYRIIALHSGQTYERIYEDGDRDYWMRSTEALEYGMIDEILERERT